MAIECCAASFTTLPATGLIVPLGEWVLRRACSDAVTWTERLIVAVNLVPAQFRDVAHVLSETELPAERLELEITESLLINNTEERCSASSTGCASGVKIAMDDFGTGYSNFSYLARFAFDKLKSRRSSREAALPDPFAVTAGSWDRPTVAFATLAVGALGAPPNSDKRPWPKGVCGLVLTTRRVCGAARLAVAARRCFNAACSVFAGALTFALAFGAGFLGVAASTFGDTGAGVEAQARRRAGARLLRV